MNRHMFFRALSLGAACCCLNGGLRAQVPGAASDSVRSAVPVGTSGVSLQAGNAASATEGTWLGLTLSQAAAGNWVQGGQDFVAAGLTLRSASTVHVGSVRARLTVSLRLGATYVNDTTSDHPLRVADNEGFAETVMSVPLGWRIDPYTSASVRTALTESFQYNGRTRRRTAAFRDPLLTQQAAGGTYEMLSGRNRLSTRLGVSMIQVSAHLNTQLTDDVRTPAAERHRLQSGLESVTETAWALDSATTFTGRLGLFGSFEDLTVWSARFECDLRLQVWKALGIVLHAEVIHDVRMSLRTQFRESIAAGVQQRF